MFVEKWMTRDPVTVAPDATLSAVAMEMNRLRFRHFPVVESTPGGAWMVGIVAKYDIARGFPANLNPFSIEVAHDSVSRPISSVMTKKVITTTPDCAIEEAARILYTHKIGALPVLRQNMLVGIITESDLFDAFLSMTAARNRGVRVMVASESGTNPVPAVLELSRRNKVDLLSLFSFQENRLKRRDLSIFRFDGRLPAGFLQELAALGFRIVSVVRRER